MKKFLWFFINYYLTIDFLWAFKACKEIISKKNTFNFVILQIPTLTNIIYGVYIKKRTALPVTFDLRDDLINFKNRFGIKLLEKWMMKYGNLIVCTTRGSKENLGRKYPQWRKKLEYIPNGYDPDDFHILEPRMTTLQRKASIIYTGVLYESRLMVVKQLFKTIKIIQNENENIFNNINFIFYTSNKNIEILISSFKLNVIVKRFNIISDRNNYINILQNADYLLSLNMDTPYSIPGKLYEYLAVNPNVIHIDNNSIAEEVLRYFPQSKLVLLDNFVEIKNILKIITRSHQKEPGQIKLPRVFEKSYSRKNISIKFANQLLIHNFGN